jgi:hypothetical protein
MSAMLRFSGAGKRDPIIEEWLNKTDALTAVARTWFRRMRACGEDVQELMHDGHPVVCVEDAPFAYVSVFRTICRIVVQYLSLATRCDCSTQRIRAHS